MTTFLSRALGSLLLCAGLWAGVSTLASAKVIPQVGETAPDFTLSTLDDQPVELAQLAKSGPVVLIVLRGWPGYQCPICSLQVHQYVAQAEQFAAQKAQVLMVYPGPAEALKAHAEDFLKDKSWPKNFLFVTDPDYRFTQLYALRWSAPKETAYPSTFIIDPHGLIRFAHTSHTHKDRIDPAAALAALAKIDR